MYIFLDLMGCLNESADLHASSVEAKSQVLECSVCVFSVQCCIEALSFCCCWKDRTQSKCRRERWRQREVSFAVEDHRQGSQSLGGCEGGGERGRGMVEGEPTKDPL